MLTLQVEASSANALNASNLCFCIEHLIHSYTSGSFFMVILIVNLAKCQCINVFLDWVQMPLSFKFCPSPNKYFRAIPLHGWSDHPRVYILIVYEHNVHFNYEL